MSHLLLLFTVQLCVLETKKIIGVWGDLQCRETMLLTQAVTWQNWLLLAKAAGQQDEVFHYTIISICVVEGEIAASHSSISVVEREMIFTNNISTAKLSN